MRRTGGRGVRSSFEDRLGPAEGFPYGRELGVNREERRQHGLSWGGLSDKAALGHRRYAASPPDRSVSA